jgi:serine/threonine-protein kinase HipA
MTTAEIWLWGSRIGAVTLPADNRFATFEYDPNFVGSGIELSPITMPLSRQTYRFPALPTQTFHGLPGLLADCLPDRYGNAVIAAWLATQGRLTNEFNAVERLCYTGSRGMGALEFRPASGPDFSTSEQVDIHELTRLASQVLADRSDLNVTLADENRAKALKDILRVGTSAGGARAKAVIAWNPSTHEVRSGQVKAPEGFEYWLIKFDGVANNRDRELVDPQGFGAIEYAYFKMALDAGLEMNPCRLLEEGGRQHFMTQRFDRLADGNRLHMQSLAALAHLDFKESRAHSYEQSFVIMRRLNLPHPQIRQQFRRMVFNIVSRNQDDHVKNIAFLMDRSGQWSLSPAFDIGYAYNPQGDWTSQHQMSVNFKRDNFTLDDLIIAGRSADLSAREVKTMLGEVTDSLSRWSQFAADSGVRPQFTKDIARNLRLTLR